MILQVKYLILEKDDSFIRNIPRHLVAVDCIIFGYDILEKEIKLLLIKRSFEPAKGRWSLAGGFVEGE